MGQDTRADLSETMRSRIKSQCGSDIRAEDVDRLVPYLIRLEAQSAQLRALDLGSEPDRISYIVERRCTGEG
jgi:hypothetical protein